MKQIVVAGGSTAGLSAAEELRAQGFEGTIQVVDQEPEAPYRRPAVSKSVLTGTSSPEDAAQRVADDLQLERLAGGRLLGLDVEARAVRVRLKGETVDLPFDGLVIATGCRARELPVADSLDGIYSLRSLGDGVNLRAALVGAERVVIVGAGFVGLEVGSSARSMGLPVTIVEAADRPLEHAVGHALSEHIARVHDANGIEILTNARVDHFEGRDAVEAVVLADGRRLEADVVVTAVGALPEVEWLEGSGLDCTDGVRCDDSCAARGVSGIVAAGDVARWHNPLYGKDMRIEHWTHAIEQGAFAARRLLGKSASGGFASAPYFWSDQMNMRIQSVGVCSLNDEENILEQSGDSMLVAFTTRGRLTGVVGINTGTTVMRARRHLLEPTSIAEFVAVAS